MGARGPQKKPNQLKRLAGNPGRRPLNDAAPEPTGRPVKPAYVKGYAATVWKKITTSMPEGLYTACDASLLATYCVAAALHKEATEMIEVESGVGINPRGTPYKNPWVSILNRQTQLMATVGSRLGLDPATRSSLKAPDLKKSSKFADLITMNGGKK